MWVSFSVLWAKAFSQIIFSIFAEHPIIKLLITRSTLNLLFNVSYYLNSQFDLPWPVLSYPSFKQPDPGIFFFLREGHLSCQSIILCA